MGKLLVPKSHTKKKKKKSKTLDWAPFAIRQLSSHLLNLENEQFKRENVQYIHHFSSVYESTLWMEVLWHTLDGSSILKNNVARSLIKYTIII